MENTISNIFDKYTQQSDTNVLDTILDDITLESAMSMNAEHQSILNAYEVMDKIQNDLTTESAISDCNSYLKETLATINLTPEYFGFEENITIECAVLTIESGDSIWKKMWEWIKEKVKQIKDWVVKVFKSIFNKSKVQYDTLEQLEKIKLGKPKNDFMDNGELLNLSGFMPLDMNKYTLGLLFYNNLYKEILYTLKDVDFVSNLTVATNKVLNIIEVNNNNDNMNSLLKLNNKKALFKRIGRGTAEYLTFNINNNVIHTAIIINNIDSSVSVQPGKKYKTLTPVEINNIIKNCKKILLENINREDKALQSIMNKLNVMISDNPERIPVVIIEGNGMVIGKVTTLLKILDCITTYTTFQHSELNKCVKYLALNIKNYIH